MKAGLGKKGWIYMLDRCRDDICRVHLVFHGCFLHDDAIGDVFVRRNGVNEWAESNGIIVIYPQTTSSFKNPFGCWGFTNPNFLTSPDFKCKRFSKWLKVLHLLPGLKKS